MNYYDILEISPNATPQDIKKAYRRKATELHPDTLGRDTSPSLRHLAEERFKELNHIYEVLSDPDQRQKYHQEMHETERYDLIQEIGKLCDGQRLEAALTLAYKLYQQFPQDSECCDIYAEVLYALAIQLSEQPEKRQEEQVRTYLETALKVVCLETLRIQIKADLEIFNQRHADRVRSHNPEPSQYSSSGTQITTQRALQLLKAGEAGIKAWNQFRQYETDVPSLAGVDLSETDLSLTNLQGLDLTGADLTNANLASANLMDAQLGGANLTGIQGEQCNFMAVNLERATLTDSHLKEADFSRANLTAAVLDHADAQQSIFRDAILKNVQWVEGNLNETDCQQANFSGAILTRSTGKKANFAATTFTNARWEHAVLLEADFSESNLERMELLYASLQGAVFTATRLCGTNLDGSSSQNNKKPPYHSVGIDFVGADLSCASLVEVSLMKSNFANTILQNTNFDRADLRGSNLQNAQINNTSFLGTNLRDTDLSGTRFYYAYVDIHTNVSGAKGL